MTEASAIPYSYIDEEQGIYVQPNEIYFLSNSKLLLNSGDYYVAELGSSDPPVNITNGAYIYQLYKDYQSMHPTQRKYIYKTYDSTARTYSLGIINPDGSLVSVPGSEASNYDDYSFKPRWLPDGTKFIFKKPNGAGYDLWIAAADGSAATQLTNSPEVDDYDTKVLFHAKN
jgi:hypothetical protein